MCSYAVFSKSIRSARARDEKCVVNLDGKLGLEWRVIRRVNVLREAGFEAVA
jgi:hypothetical protein